MRFLVLALVVASLALVAAAPAASATYCSVNPLKHHPVDIAVCLARDCPNAVYIWYQLLPTPVYSIAIGCSVGP